MKFRLLSVPVLLAFSFSAVAANGYVGFSVGSTDVKVDLTSLGGGQLNESTSLLKFYGGYRLHKYVAIEAAYFGLAQASVGQLGEPPNAVSGSVDMKALGERTIRIDCDVLQADGGTRTASITGGAVALADAINTLPVKGAFKAFVASISVGIYKGVPVLDLDYREDSNAETDMNVVCLDQGGFIEVQGTAEGAPFSGAELSALIALAEKGTAELIALQTAALGVSG